jgi:GT2 family glycosyltransferase
MTVSAVFSNAAFPADLVLTPVRRWPTTLPDTTVRTILDVPLTDRVPPRAAGGQPAASLVVVTHNGLVFSRLCFESLLAAASPIEFELLVVDNASTDGTREYLGELAARDARVRVVSNYHNAGFAAATNQGVEASRGDVVVFLNNDTIPNSNGLARLSNHLRTGSVGLVGAVTNRAGNEAEIAAPYTTYGELRQFAGEYAAAHAGELFDIRTATMFCAAIRRAVCNTIGPLDERFEIGLFEDDDYSMRVRAAGLRVAYAEDVFIHHFGQASIGQLGATGEYGALFHANRARWEEKWGTDWVPYDKRARPGYDVLVEQIRRFVCDATPPDATVLVISKGDTDLLNLDTRPAWHFPRDPAGGYAGHHPPDSEACIAELERLRSEGADFLVIPQTSRWWLDHYAGFADHLRRRYRAVGDERSPATIIALRGYAA